MIIDIIAWIVVGGLAGWIASKIMNTDAQMGVPANVIVGIVGAFIGGLLMRLLTGSTTDTFSIGGFIVAIIGAVILLALVKALQGSGTKREL